MHRTATLLAAFALAGGIATAPANASHTDGHSGGGGNGPQCVVYGGIGGHGGDVDNCDNNGHMSALELFGCDIYNGVPHYAWTGVTAYGRVATTFGMPIAARKDFLIPGKPKFQFHTFDAHLQESAYRVWALDYTLAGYPGGSWMAVTWLVCCSCKSKAEMHRVYVAHVLPKIRSAMTP